MQNLRSLWNVEVSLNLLFLGLGFYLSICLIQISAFSEESSVTACTFSCAFFHLLLQADQTEQEESDTHFMRLVQNLLRDPQERTNFFQVFFFAQSKMIVLNISNIIANCQFCEIYGVLFLQDVFPEDFGPTYDKAIQTLMWLFLSRLEKLIPAKTLQQVHIHVYLHFVLHENLTLFL